MGNFKSFDIRYKGKFIIFLEITLSNRVVVFTGHVRPTVPGNLSNQIDFFPDIIQIETLAVWCSFCINLNQNKRYLTKFNLLFFFYS